MRTRSWKKPQTSSWKKACKTSPEKISKFIFKEMGICIHEFPKRSDSDFHKRFEEGDSDNLYKCRKCEKWISSHDIDFEPNLFTPEGFFKIRHWLIDEIGDLCDVYFQFLIWGERDGWTKNCHYDGVMLDYKIFPRVLYAFFLECIENGETFGGMLLVQNCRRCGRKLDNPKDPDSLDCGKDCKGCVELFEKVE